MAIRKEQLERMHRRAAQLEREADRKMKTLFGTASGILFAALLVLLTTAGGSLAGGQAEYTGASLLSDNVGGYVLVAVVAFAAAVIITAVCMRQRWKRRSGDSIPAQDGTSGGEADSNKNNTHADGKEKK